MFKAYNVSIRKFQRDYVSWHWKVLQKLKENWLVTWKMTSEIWLIFMQAVKNLKICTLTGSISPKHKDLDEKLQKNYVSWHWRVMQSLKKSWLLAPKITWGIWWTLMQAVASLKICTLMCYFCQQHLKFLLKKYRIIPHDTEKISKLWKITDFLFEKWRGEFGEL